MTTVRVHFDGRVFIPEEAVNIPQGRSMRIDIHEIDAPSSATPPPCARIGEHNGFPVVIVPPGTPMITSEDIRRALEED